MPFDPEAMARSIGAVQYNAMSNLWSQPSPMLTQSLGGDGDGEFKMGPFAQYFEPKTVEPYSGYNPSADRAETQTLNELFDLKSSVAREAEVAEFGRQVAYAKSMDNAATKQAAKAGGQGQDMIPDPNFKATNPFQKAPLISNPYNTSGTGTTYATGDYKTPADAAASGQVVEQYIRDAATKRGIDPEIAMRVARSEGGTEVAKRGTFATGSSWWPYQLHYGGKGYEQFGNTAGMGNSFTAETGFQPGDPAAWRASVDYALDRAQKSGWGDWYGARAQGITGKMGIGQAPQNPAPENSGAPYQVNRTSQFGLGLSSAEAQAFCGPAAAIALGNYYGNNIPVEEVKRLAQQSGWNAGQGMAGPASEVNLLHKMGVKAQSEAWNDARAQQLVSSGTPVIIDTPGHYFVADRWDPQRGYHVGTSGTDLRQGGEWLTPQQMAAIGIAGAPRTMIYA